MSKLTGIKNAARKVAGRNLLIVKKNSPQILLGVGVVSVIGGTVLACRATLKMEEVLDEYDSKKKDIEKAKEHFPEDYSEEDVAKDSVIIAVQTGASIAKLYLPAVGLGSFGIACIVGSHGILTKRNLALVASYKALDSSFSSYRNRVMARFGDEAEYQIRHNITSEKMTEEITDEESGKTKKVKVTKQVVNGNEKSIYARFFDEFNINHSSNPTQNMLFLKSQQTFMNDLLHANGHLFLNEVYDSLGMERSSAGSIVGWVISPDGDNYVDFGIYDSIDFVNGREQSILLDFNVDGVIYDLID